MLRSKAPDVYIQDTMDKKEAEAYLRGREQGYALGKSESIDIDDSLSEESENPVQNKVVTKALSNKVEKIDGKGLSTNDFTNEFKEKLEDINNGITLTDKITNEKYIIYVENGKLMMMKLESEVE